MLGHRCAFNLPYALYTMHVLGFAPFLGGALMELFTCIIEKYFQC